MVSAAHHLRQLHGPVVAAVVADAERFHAAFPLAGEIRQAQGYLDGRRVLKSLRQRHPAAAVIALQNPIAPSGRIETSLLQNHLYFSFRESLPVEPKLSNWPRLVVGTLGTSLQVARSRHTIALNRTFPRHWRRLSIIDVKPNVLAPADLRSEPQAVRAHEVAFVGSLDRFRGLHIAIEAFLRSDLAASGWRLIVHASAGMSGEGYVRHCRELAAGSANVVFADRSADPQATLSRAAIALFPSRIEGSSISFLEALALGPAIVALDREHFRAAADAATPSPTVRWIAGWDVEEWSKALVAVVSAAVATGAVDASADG